MDATLTYLIYPFERFSYRHGMYFIFLENIVSLHCQRNTYSLGPTGTTTQPRALNPTP